MRETRRAQIQTIMAFKEQMKLCNGVHLPVPQRAQERPDKRANMYTELIFTFLQPSFAIL
jgi:hypothetical protein